jgi:hypothetical protein
MALLSRMLHILRIIKQNRISDKIGLSCCTIPFHQRLMFRAQTRPDMRVVFEIQAGKRYLYRLSGLSYIPTGTKQTTHGTMAPRPLTYNA